MVSSMLTYGCFYLAIMPAHHATEQLYFDYTCDETERECRSKENSTFGVLDRIECLPTAAVDVFAKHSPWKALHPDVVPAPIAEQRRLKAAQPYFLEISLNLPESPSNLNVGMFGVSVELYSSNGTALATSIRSARLPHESRWVSLLRKSTCLIPLLIGAISETRTIIIPSYRHFVESSEYPLVSIVSAGGFCPGSRVLMRPVRLTNLSGPRMYGTS